MARDPHAPRGGFFTGDEDTAQQYGGASEAYLITRAPESFEAQQRARIRKYTILMSMRVPALILAGVAFAATGSGLLALLIVGASIPLPWIAVLIANDRPPRRKDEVSEYAERRRARAEQRALQQEHHETIDG
ncbi:DUF3099 domain-containing protein [Hoyosella sp. G463]|uniref:DUF3099 domain-containing protein n=2 Tax=Lolliginicoccus lacisalsi TaxID=2742202 RepID=A0A927J9W4_9ACTN|nr:DUF3099 domain-containing protein [Lolliginicoccus lacisalsi]MBD8505376.1 DUF3099 domain-containing protein [Lolliginicoccus lacisalsi]